MEMEPAARAVAARLAGAGFIAYFAGGCVRDALRGVVPQDFDIATDARPEQVQALFPRTVAVGAHFGVIRVLEGGFQFEVASFRADGAYIDGRRPVDVTSPRRKATPSGAISRSTACSTIRSPRRVIDYVGGRADLQRGSLRAIGDPHARFREDRLRLLRAVRFAAVLGFEVEPATWDGRPRAGRRDRRRQRRAHPGRTGQNLPRADAGARLRPARRQRSAARHPARTRRCKGCEQPPQFHPEGDVFVHTRLMLSLLPEDGQRAARFLRAPARHRQAADRAGGPDGRIRFNGHEHVGADMTLRVMERLRFSRAEIDATVEAVRQHMAFKDVPQMRVAKLKRFMARPGFEDEMELHRVDCLGSHGFWTTTIFCAASRRSSPTSR